MDFFDVIEAYENKLSNSIRQRLFINLNNQATITQDPQCYSNNKLYDEITSSKAICDLITERKKKKKKAFIFALNTPKSKANKCCNQNGFNNDYFYTQKSECSYMKQMIIKDIIKEIESLFQTQKQKANYYCAHNAMKMLNPIKMTRANRYKNDNVNNSLMNNNYDIKKNYQEKIKENRLHKLKQANMAEMKQRVDHLFEKEDLLMKTNRDKKPKLNCQSKFDVKGKNSKKRILSCRVVIQDKKS